MNINNKGNEYAALLGKLFDATPKAVFAAVAVSALHQIYGGELADVAEHIVDEWATLYANGIVPQQAPIKSNVLPYPSASSRIGEG